jgi:hypothetical protein
VEEGEACVEEIVDSLQKMLDIKWLWQLKEIGEGKYLVRFPPHRKISETVISDTTYFKLRKDGVLVSLKAWTGDIESYDVLEEVWVQVSGIPPKWSNWEAIMHIASSIGKMLEVDRNSMFASFFGMVRIKVACKDISKIPKKRLYEMKQKLYLIHFKVEKMTTSGESPDDDEGEVMKVPRWMRMLGKKN